MKRIAVIDLGTNTFHLLITEVNDHTVPGNLCQETIPVKLGEGGIKEGLINAEAFQRGIMAMELFSSLISRHQATEVKALATAAIRTASNGQDFISEIKKRTGIDIEGIDGEKEAGLIYAGVRHAVRMHNETALIMDIGGGSVEFIICNNSTIFWKRSFPLGAAKLMDQFHHSDPISNEDIRQITIHLDQTLAELFPECDKHKPTMLIGSAGAFESFAELVKRRINPNEARTGFPSTEIKLDSFQKLAAILLKSTHLERTQMPGLIPLRVDMIIVATILSQYIIRKLKPRTLMLSDYSLKEGVLFDLLSC